MYFPSPEREGPSHAPDTVPRTSMPHKPSLTDGCHYSSVTSPHDKKITHKAGTNATRGLGSKFSEGWMICVSFEKEGQTSKKKNQCNLCFHNLWKGLILKVTWGQRAEKRFSKMKKSSPPPVLCEEGYDETLRYEQVWELVSFQRPIPMSRNSTPPSLFPFLCSFPSAGGFVELAQILHGSRLKIAA